jgi:ABC-type multidrug transport system fused ATPase/permease subunit
LKRLESNAKSPVFELFNTTLAGISTIRAFRRTQTYLEQMHNNLNAWTMTTFYIALANRWMSLRMALITALFSITVGVVIIVKQIDAALAGLALSFILDFSESLRWTIRSYGDMELEMNSMERVVEYMNIETEYLGGLRPAAAWPTSGSVEVKGLEVAYAPDLPPVLKGLSFKIKHGERVGVVGRTGAGKSSMTLALFRFLEAKSGSIAIDGVDISKLKLTALRSKMSIIPQVCSQQYLNCRS